MEDLRVNLRDMRELYLVDFGAPPACRRRLIGEGDIEHLGPGVEFEFMDGKHVLAAIINAERGETSRVVCEAIERNSCGRSYICGATSNCRRWMRAMVMRVGRVFSEGEMTTVQK